MIKQDKWIWYGNALHFIGGNNCRFHLATKVGKYLISTVGELLWDSEVREILAKSRGIILKGRGDDRKADYIKKIGFEEIGYNRKFETMVFRLKKKSKCGCSLVIPRELDTASYNTHKDANKGHYKMCLKWSRKA